MPKINKMLDRFYPYKKLDSHKQAQLINGDRKDVYISLFQ